MLRSLASDSFSGLSGSANTFNVIAFFVFIFNLLLGNAYLFIPFAFYDAGIFASCLLLLFLSFLSCLTAVWTLEVLCRSQALEYYQIRNSFSHREVSPSNHTRQGETKSYGSTENSDVQTRLSRPEPLPIYEISAERKFEISELCEKFLGKTSKWIYTLVLAVQTFLFLWSTATVVGTTMTGIHWLLKGGEKCYDRKFGKMLLTEDPSCKNIYRIYIAVFGAVVMPLSCVRIRHQKWFQILSAGCRIVIIVLVIGFYVWVDKPVKEDNGNHHNSSSFTNESAKDNVLAPFKINLTILRLIPIITCSQLIHFAIPNLVHITRARTSLRKSLCVLYFSCWVVLTVHSLLLVIYFKDFLKPNAPHTWAYFTTSSSTSTKVLAYFIQLSPVLNGISVYPMLSAILADALYSAFSGTDTSTISSERKIFEFRRIRVLAVSLSATPLVFSLEIYDVADINQFVSILSLVIVLAFPALLQYKSRMRCQYVLHGNTGRRYTIEKAHDIDENSIQYRRTVSNYHRRNKKIVIKDTPYSMPYLSSNNFSIFVFVTCVFLIISSFVGTLL